MNDLQPVPAVAGALPTTTPTREQIEHLESELFALVKRDGEVVIIPEHHHANGLYCRSVMIPAGTVLTGAAHREEHLNVCVGDIDVWTEDGMRRLTGINVLPSHPGCKRAGFAHADTWWMTIHANPDNVTSEEALAELFLEDASKLSTRRVPFNAQPEELAQ